MKANLQNIFKWIFFERKLLYFDSNFNDFYSYYSKGPIDHESVIGQVMALHLTNTKPLRDPMFAKMPHAIIRLQWVD